MGRRRRCRDGGQRRQGLRLPRREDLEQALLGDEAEAAASAGVEQEEGRGDAWATVADEDVMLST